jgi:methionine-rich copper-binding protein CopC
MTPSQSLKPFASAACAAGLILAAGQAQAHARLLSSTPAADTTVVPPQKLALHFSEKLEPKFSAVELMKADGAKIEIKSSVLSDDPKTIEGDLAAPLQHGSYMVMWHAVSADGHRTQGDYNFTVR